MLTVDLLKTLYYTMIHLYFLYCNVVWGGACKLAVNKLICLQKRAARLLTHSTFVLSVIRFLYVNYTFGNSKN